VILTDHNYQILTLLRSHRDDDKGRSTMARHPYPMHAIRLRQPLALDTLTAALAAAAAEQHTAAAAAAGGGGPGKQQQGKEVEEDLDGLQLSGSDGEEEGADQQQQQPATNGTATAAAAAGGGKKKAGGKGGKGGSAAGASSGPVLKAILGELVPYGPAVAEHCCLSAGLQPQHPVGSQPLTQQQVGVLYGAVQQFESWLAGLDQGQEAEGFITATHTAASRAQQQKGQGHQQQQQEGEGEKKEGVKAPEGLVYQEYNPLRLQGMKQGGEVLTFSSFDDALDEYYGKVRRGRGAGGL